MNDLVLAVISFLAGIGARDVVTALTSRFREAHRRRQKVYG